MKYLNELTKLKIFTFSDFVKLVGNENLANVTIYNYLKKGYIIRIKNNLYSTISLETNNALADKFLIASFLTNTSFVSHHSAFEYYGYYNQVFDTVNVSSISKFNEFEFEGNRFILKQVNNDEFVNEIRGVRVTSIERTIVDCINDSGKVCELEEILNCIQMIPYISIENILKYLELCNSKMLYKKVGIILSLFIEHFNIPESFFDKCHQMSDNVRGYFNNNKKKSQIYYSKWKIYMDKEIENYIAKE